MQISSHVEKTLFHDQTSANREYFESKAGQLFVQQKELFAQQKERFYIELHTQPPFRKVPKSSVDSDHTFTVVQKCEADPSFHPKSPAGLWVHEDGSSGTQPERWRISDVNQLKDRAAVRSNNWSICLYLLHLTT